LAEDDRQLGSADLDTRLNELWETARVAYPGVKVAVEAFVAHLARHMERDRPEDYLSRVHAADLYLACACAAGNTTALSRFDESLLSQVGAFVAGLRAEPAFVDDLRQTIREKLFVGRTPKIADYSGRGALTSWLRVLSLRTALSLKRRKTELLDGGQQSSATNEARPSMTRDPELDFIKEQYRGLFRSALDNSLGSLSQEERNLLRLHFLKGVTLEELATLFRVHRATIARRIAQARDNILRNTSEQVQAQLGVDSAEFESLMKVLHSQIDVSISRLLQP
jgi:RNA polymerase sigma-70 factor (ECF subfamily)